MPRRDRAGRTGTQRRDHCGRAARCGQRAAGALEPVDQRRGDPARGAGARADPPRRAAGPFRRRALPDQGPGRLPRRGRVHRIFPLPRRLRARARQRTLQALRTSGTAHFRQDQHTGIRTAGHHREPLSRPCPQPLADIALTRRQFWRLGRCRGGAHRTDGARRRWRRLDPHPSFRLRPVRPQALARAHPDGTRRERAMERPGAAARRDRECARQRPLAGRNAGARYRRPLHGSATGAALRRRGQTQPGCAANRLLQGLAVRTQRASGVRRCRGRHGKAARATGP